MKKKNFNFYVGMFCGKVGTAIFRILGKKDSHVPGRWAKKFCPDFLEYLEKPEKLVYIIGTHGKQTVFRLTAQVLKAQGVEFIADASAVNDEEGVISALLSKTAFSGASSAKLAVLKVDEISLDSIFSSMQPDICLCTNICRDGQEYKGSQGHIVKKLNQYLTDETLLIYNSDDPASVSLNQAAKGISFDCSVEGFPVLGERLTDHWNEAAAICLLSQIGLTDEQIRTSLENGKKIEGSVRLELVGGKEIYMCLAKGQGPTANDHIFKRISEKKQNCSIIMLNYDQEEDQHSSENTSWLYETHYELLAKDWVKQILIGGKRCFDYKVRALLAGVEENRLECALNPEDVVKLVNITEAERVYIFYAAGTYSKASEIKSYLKKRMEKEAEQDED